jgi:hypothetical protein
MEYVSAIRFRRNLRFKPVPDARQVYFYYLRLSEASKRRLFVIEHIKNRKKFSDGEQLMDFARQIQKLQLPPAVDHRRIGTHQLTNAGAVDIADIGEVENNLFCSALQDIPYRVADRHRSFAQRDFAAAIQNFYIPYRSYIDFHKESPFICKNFSYCNEIGFVLTAKSCTCALRESNCIMASWSPGGDGTGRTRLENWTEALRLGDRNGDGRLSRYEVGNPDALQRFFRMDTDRSGDLNRAEWERQAGVFRRAQNGTLAIKPSGTGGEQDDGAIIWEYARDAPHVATPLLDRGILWLVKDGGIVTKISADSGKVLQEKRLPAIGNYYASPVSADGKVYFAGEQGVVIILADTPDWHIISTHDFGEKIYATPLFANGCLYIRTEKALYCFRNNE